jgi:hypothetical protein
MCATYMVDLSRYPVVQCPDPNGQKCEAAGERPHTSSAPANLRYPYFGTMKDHAGAVDAGPRFGATEGLNTAGTDLRNHRLVSSVSNRRADIAKLRGTGRQLIAGWLTPQCPDLMQITDWFSRLVLNDSGDQ